MPVTISVLPPPIFLENAVKRSSLVLALRKRFATSIESTKKNEERMNRYKLSATRRVEIITEDYY